MRDSLAHCFYVEFQTVIFCWKHRVVFLGKTLCSYIATLHLEES